MQQILTKIKALKIYSKTFMEESGRKIQSFTFPKGLNVKSKQAIYQTGFLFELLCSKRSEQLTESGSYSNVTLQWILYIFLIIESF